MASTILNGTYVTHVVLADQYTTVASAGAISVSNKDAIYGASGTPWSVTSYGQVTDTGTIGTAIHLVGSGSVTNEAKGLLEGASDGILIGVNTSGTLVSGATGTVNNYGTVGTTGKTFNVGVLLGAGGSVTNQSGGVITGFTAIEAQSGAGTITNSGTIRTALFLAVNLGSGGSVTNQTGGAITGGTGGVLVAGAAGTVSNAGLISGNAGTGVYMAAGGQIANLAGGALAGASEGVLIEGGSASLSNAGAIAGYTGVLIETDPGTVSNSGIITGAAVGGVELDAGGQVTNAVGGVIRGYRGLLALGPAIVTNYGTIAGTSALVTATAPGPGIDLSAGGTLTNGNSGDQTATVSSIEGIAVTIGNTSGATGTIVNFGTISTTTTDTTDKLIPAVYLPSGGIVTNYGLITGSQPGSVTGQGAINTRYASATIRNFGTIAGTQGSEPIAMAHGGLIVNGATNVTTALMSGTLFAIRAGYIPSTAIGGGYTSGATVTIVNYGTIKTTGTARAIAIAAGGTVTNAAGGTITGYSGIGARDAAAIVVNYGTIQATSTVATAAAPGIGIDLAAGGAVTNGSAGNRNATISSAEGSAVFIGSTAGGAGTIVNFGTISTGTTDTTDRLIPTIYLGAGGTVTNYGVIQGAQPPASGDYQGVITTPHAYATIRNLGTIAATNVSDGIHLDHGGTIVNGSTSATAATITGRESGIYGGGQTHVAYSSGAAAFITNYGTIRSTGTADGIRLVGGGIVTNEATGLISAYGNAISTADTPLTVANYGTITNSGNHAAIYLGAGGTVINGSTANKSATIYSPLRTGVSAENGPATIINFGTIDSGAPITATAGIGVYLQDGGAITNDKSGVIEANRVGLRLGGSISTSGALVATNFGEIIGSVGVSVQPLDAGSNTILNYGTITGSGGTAVQLTGAATTLVIEPNSVLSGAITGFVAGDALDFAEVAGNSASYASGVLTLLNGGSAVASVELTGLIPSAQIVVAPDGANGTDVTVLPPIVSSGQSLVVSSGQAVGQATVQSGGTLEVQSCGVADATAVVSGGSLVVTDGGTAVGGTVSSGGSETLQSGGTAIGDSIAGDSTQIVSSGATASNTVVGDPSIEQVSAGGVTVSTVLVNGGVELLQGMANHTVVAGGGTFEVLSGGSADGTTLSGGFLVVSSGAQVTSGGVSGVVSGAGTVEFIDGGYVIAGNSGLVVSVGSSTNVVNVLVGGDTVVGGAGNGEALVFGGLGDVVEDALGRPFVTQSGGTNATIFALSAGAALFYAGAGDTLVGGGGTAVAIGAAGDEFVLGSGNDTVNVIPTGESITFGGGAAIIFGGPGDTIGDAAGTVVTFTSGSNAIVLAGSGDSVLLYSGPGDTLVGGNAASTVIGSANDMFELGSAADTVNAFPANEVVELGSGQNETIYGGAGDTIEAAGGAAMVTFVGGSEGIVFAETAGQDQLYSGPGDTLLIGTGTLNIIGSANNVLTLGSGTDTVNALPPNESVTFGTGNATVFGGDGDTIGTGAGTVVVLTGGNNAIVAEDVGGAITVNDGAGDTITAGSVAAAVNGAKNSAIVLGSANDTVTGANNDTITTRAGSDAIDFGASHSAGEFLAPGAGTDTSANDTVVNFSQATGDLIQESGSDELNTLASAQLSGGNITITLADGSTVTLLGVTAIDTTLFG